MAIYPAGPAPMMRLHTVISMRTRHLMPRTYTSVKDSLVSSEVVEGIVMFVVEIKLEEERQAVYI